MSALPDALLFDMDGTIVDSDPYWMEAEHNVLLDYGVPWTKELGMTSVGVPLGIWVEGMFAQFSLSGDHAKASAEIEAEVAEIFATRGALWRPGARRLMELSVELGIPSALVTATHSRIVEEIHASAPAGALEVVVTGDMVSAGKPDPEGYRRAMGLLGVKPDRAVAFEDSPSGVKAAQSSGAITVLVPFMVDVPRTAGLHVIDSLERVDEETLRALVG